MNKGTLYDKNKIIEDSYKHGPFQIDIFFVHLESFLLKKNGIDREDLTKDWMSLRK